MLTDFSKAIAQFRDPRFAKTVFKAIFLTSALLLFCLAPFYGFLWLVLPETLTIPYLGVYHPAAWLGEIAVGLVIFALIFLMFPVALLVVGFFLDSIAEAVEAKHYPHLAPVEPLGIWEIIKDAFQFVLLGREYFQLVAMRRLGRKAATKLRRKNGGQIWIAGIMMAIPLSVPIINILVPLLGVATFTHMFHRLIKPADQ